MSDDGVRIEWRRFRKGAIDRATANKRNEEALLEPFGRYRELSDEERPKVGHIDSVSPS
jgi:hypothetical protein